MTLTLWMMNRAVQSTDSFELEIMSNNTGTVTPRGPVITRQAEDYKHPHSRAIALKDMDNKVSVSKRVCDTCLSALSAVVVLSSFLILLLETLLGLFGMVVCMNLYINYLAKASPSCDNPYGLLFYFALALCSFALAFGALNQLFVPNSNPAHEMRHLVPLVILNYAVFLVALVLRHGLTEVLRFLSGNFNQDRFGPFHGKSFC